MTKSSERQHTASHKSVSRGPRPTRLNGQTSHAVAKDQSSTDEIRPMEREIVRFRALDRDRSVLPIGCRGVLDECFKQPGHARPADNIVRCLEIEIICDVASVGRAGPLARLGEHFRPHIVQFAHLPEDRTRRIQLQFRAMIQEYRTKRDAASTRPAAPDSSGVMNKAFSIILLLALAASAVAQGSQPAKASAKKITRKSFASVKKPKPELAPDDPEADRKRFDEALAASTTAEKARLLREFLNKFPESELREEAFTYLITARAVVGNELVQGGDVAAGTASFKLAVEEAPTPIPDRMFSDVILKIPGSLFYGNQRPAAMELAQLIEKKVAANPKQLLAMAAFYLGIENGAEAKRVAETVIAADPGSAGGYQALGLAHRLNFDLEESSKAYAKAAELDATSVPARRSLAEMHRALGKPEAAATLYREIVSANENDAVARQGLVLSLFDSGQQKEAEAELGKLLQSDPRNFSLLTGVAYWYAANEQADKAVEYAQKAVDVEPRYIWGHIVLARGLMKQNKPVDAERALLRARQYGNFPTLDYEIASARFQAGLYREAVEELQKSFSLKNGLLGTKLGGRIYKEEKSFQDLVAYERKASLLQPLAADRLENSEKLRLLFELTRKVDQVADESELVALADEFVNGTDRMKLHRQLYVANLFLQKGIALPKVAELVKASMGNVDAGLEVSAPGAAIMASELYESRAIAFARNEVVIIPEVPRQTLSAIVRGRIEELAGWTLYQQKKYPDAIVRLRRAVSVLPDKSAWWRGSMWRLGAALEADGKDKEALDSYIQSYVTDRPSPIRYGAIEALYRRINGNTDGLEEKIGPNPLVASSDARPLERPIPPPPHVDTSAPPPERTPQGAVPAAVNSEQTVKFPRHVPAQPISLGSGQTDLTSDRKSEISAEAITPVTAEAAPPQAEPKTGDPTVEKIKQETALPAKDDRTDAAAGRTSGDISTPPTVPVAKAEPEPEDIVLPKATEKLPAETEIPSGPVKNVNSDAPVPAATDLPVNKEPEPVRKESEPVVGDRTGVKETDVQPPPTDVPVLSDEPPAAVKKTYETGTEKKPGDPPPLTNPVEDTAGKETPPEPQPARITSVDRKTETVNAEPPAVSETRAEDSSDKPAADAGKKETPISDPPAAAETPTDRPTIDRPKTDPPEAPADRAARSGSVSDRSEGRTEKRPLVIINDPFKPKAAPANPNKLFEPVIIKIPGAQKSADTAAAVVTTDNIAASEATGRRRVIAGKEITSDQQCSIDVSHESIMLLSGGGSLGLRVTVNGGDPKEVTASSSSPRDIEVRPEPTIDSVGRRFYVIKSVSDRAGIFQVNFESPCGKREVPVHVR